jgi:hypothetical protein
MLLCEMASLAEQGVRQSAERLSLPGNLHLVVTPPLAPSAERRRTRATLEEAAGVQGRRKPGPWSPDQIAHHHPSLSQVWKLATIWSGKRESWQSQETGRRMQPAIRCCLPGPAGVTTRSLCTRPNTPESVPQPYRDGSPPLPTGLLLLMQTTPGPMEHPATRGRHQNLQDQRFYAGHLSHR